MKKLILGIMFAAGVLIAGMSAEACDYGYGDGYYYGGSSYYGYYDGGYGYPHGAPGTHTYRYSPRADFWGSFEEGPGYHAYGYAYPYRSGTHHGYHYNAQHGWHSGTHYGDF